MGPTVTIKTHNCIISFVWINCLMYYYSFIGEFGKVHSGWFKSGNTYIEVAIKETKGLSHQLYCYFGFMCMLCNYRFVII